MRLLGVDYGTKRVGLALSDETGLIAREFTVLSPKECLKRIEKITTEQEVAKVVVGLPLNMSGGETEKTKEAKEFMGKIAEITKLPIIPFDERLSSVMAERLPGGRAKTDSLAAQIILQNYLDTQNKHE